MLSPNELDVLKRVCPINQQISLLAGRAGKSLMCHRFPKRHSGRPHACTAVPRNRSIFFGGLEVPRAPSRPPICHTVCWIMCDTCWSGFSASSFCKLHGGPAGIDETQSLDDYTTTPKVHRQQRIKRWAHLSPSNFKATLLYFCTLACFSSTRTNRSSGYSSLPG